MNARVYVGILLILIGVICLPSFTSQAQQPVGWAGATAWCWKIGNNNNEAIAHASVGWGRMVSGGWTTSAIVFFENGDFLYMSSTGRVHNGGGGDSHIHETGVVSGSSYSHISGRDQGGNWHTDNDTGSM